MPCYTCGRFIDNFDHESNTRWLNVTHYQLGTFTPTTVCRLTYHNMQWWKVTCQECCGKERMLMLAKGGDAKME